MCLFLSSNYTCFFKVQLTGHCPLRSFLVHLTRSNLTSPTPFLPEYLLLLLDTLRLGLCLQLLYIPWQQMAFQSVHNCHNQICYCVSRNLVLKNIIWPSFTPYAYAPQLHKGNSEFKHHHKLIPKATLVPNSIRALEQSLQLADHWARQTWRVFLIN